MTSLRLGALATFLTASLTAFLVATSVEAATTWTDWTSFRIGALLSAAGTLAGVDVSYSGEEIDAVINGTSNIWAPNSSFTGGTVTTSPSIVGDDIRLTGC